jgi:hypothetical protein
MDRFAHEKMRVETARLETERQKAKFLIVAENASALFKHAAASAADLTVITAESEAAVARRERPHDRP